MTTLIKKELTLITLDGQKSPHGNLFYWENKELFPFGIQRCFWINEVSGDNSRGNHAHWEESQVLVAVHGSVEVLLHEPGEAKRKFTLDHPEKGLFVPPLHWVETRFEEGAVLLGLSDREFSEQDYIRDIQDFENLQKGNHR